MLASRSGISSPDALNYTKFQNSAKILSLFIHIFSSAAESIRQRPPEISGGPRQAQTPARAIPARNATESRQPP